LREEKAIVSDIPGTTRDAIEDTVVINGIQYRFTDTAGLRDTDDVIENLGIQKTHEKIDSAALIILVADINEGPGPIAGALSALRDSTGSEGKRIIIAVNKTDIEAPGRRHEILDNLLPEAGESLLFISAKTGEGTDELKLKLGEAIDQERLNSEDVIITNIRHYEALSQVRESLTRVKEGLESGLQEDLIATDIRQAIHYLGEITGEITSDEILGNIFKYFCIGK